MQPVLSYQLNSPDVPVREDQHGSDSLPDANHNETNRNNTSNNKKNVHFSQYPASWGASTTEPQRSTSGRRSPLTELAMDPIPQSSSGVSNRPTFPTMLRPLVTRHHRRLPSDPIIPSSEEGLGSRTRHHRHFVRDRIRRPRRRKHGRFDFSARMSCRSVLQERESKKKLVISIISFFFLASTVAIYLALSVSQSLDRKLHILLIIMVILLAVVFCHSLIRFVIVFLRGPNSNSSRNRVPSRAGSVGYSQPECPIQVVTVDEESLVGNIDDDHGTVREKSPTPPPAYGLWRSSVRINPELLYWERVPREQLSENVINEEPDGHRPPSYVSNNGVDYIMDAQPRPFASNLPANAPDCR